MKRFVVASRTEVLYSRIKLTGYEYMLDSSTVDIFIVAPWGPPDGPPVNNLVISVEIWYDEIHLQSYFPRNHPLMNYTVNPNIFDSRDLREFCDSVIVEEDRIIKHFKRNKELAKSGNVTWDIFGINAIFSSFLSSPDYSKPIKLLSMVVSIIHLLTAAVIIIPSIPAIRDIISKS